MSGGAVEYVGGSAGGSGVRALHVAPVELVMTPASSPVVPVDVAVPAEPPSPPPPHPAAIATSASRRCARQREPAPPAAGTAPHATGTATRGARVRSMARSWK